MVTESQVGVLQGQGSGRRSRRRLAAAPPGRGRPPRRARATASRCSALCAPALPRTSPSRLPAPCSPRAPRTCAGHWVFGVAPRQVRDVYVAGELVVADRCSTRVDEAKVAQPAAPARRSGCGRRLEEVPPHTITSRREGETADESQRSTCRTSTRSATAWSTPATPRSAASRPYGRPRAGWSGRQRFPWPPTPR